jgi:ParB family transcriptional regulator, chromosome partitioning protein
MDKGDPMPQVISVSPFRCRVWALHDRLEAGLIEEKCKAEINSFLNHGQLVPALGRRIADDPDHDIELIYGARRLFVARHLNQPLKVEVREMSDVEAIIAMDIENRQRRDISPYEQALCYTRWLRSKIFGSQDEIARTLGVSKSQVSRMLKLSRLPAVVVGAFKDPTTICENWGLDLMELWEDAGIRTVLAERARSISGMRQMLPPREVYKRLMESRVKGRPPRTTSHDVVVADDSGEPLFRIRRQQKWVVLMLPAATLSADELREINDRVSDVLRRGRTDADRSVRVRRSKRSDMNGIAAAGRIGTTGQ